MRSLLVLSVLAAALAVGGPANAKGPHAVLMPGPEAPEAGRPWEATLDLLEFGDRGHVELVARRGSSELTAGVRRVPAKLQDVRRYETTLRFPSEGRWELVALSGGRSFEFGPVSVGSGRPPRQHTAFAGQPYRNTMPLPPEEFTVAADDAGDGGLPLWVFPLAGVVLAGAGLLTLRSR